MTKQTTFYLILCLFLFTSVNVFSQAPVITKQPHSHGVIQGQKATFSIEATGDTLTYQWYLNDNPIGGAIDSIYSTPITALAHNGEQFYVIVSNTHGKDTSKVVTLYVTATNNRVTGSQIVLYNFKERNGNKVKDISGESNPLDLTINNISSIDWSNYGLYVKDGALIESSNINASQRINDAITSSDEFTVEMWIKPLSTQNARIIDYGTSGTNNFNIEQLSPNGYSFVVLTDDINAPKGNGGILDTLKLSKDLIHLTVTQSSVNEIQRIYRNGVEVASDSVTGDVNNWIYPAYLSLGSVLGGSAPWQGIFYLAAIYNRVLDSIEIAHNFSIGVNGTNMPFIIKEPQTAKVLIGYSAVFSVAAVSDSPLSYQWQKNGVNISDATDSLYTITSVALTDSSKDEYRVIVTNSSGSDTSKNATIIVKSVNPVCPNGITHYYHLDETSSPYKDTVGFSNGVSSIPSVPVSGIVNNAQNFSNNEKIDIPSDNSFNWKATDNFSIEFWIKTNNSPSDIAIFVGRSGISTPLWWWIGLNPNGHVLFQLINTNNQNAITGDNGPVVNDNNWHLVTAIRDKNLNKNYLYIDGNKIDSVSINYNTGFEGDTPINVGYLASSYYYNGSLDELAFYSVALSQSEIQNHYSKGLKGVGYCEAIPTIKAPSNLKAIRDNIDTTNVKLSWDDNSTNELGFILQRKMGDSSSVNTYMIIDTLGFNTTSYIDSTTSDTTKYTYRIYAYNADTISVFSNIATITTPLPVELTTFTANATGEKVTVEWETATEINNAGFSIERSKDNKKFSEITFIKGKGTSTEKSFYSYIDKSALSGKYYYRLKQVDFDGTYQYLKSVEVDMGIPTNYSLEQNYPNPFNPSTIIRFAVPMNAKVNIRLYNTLGQVVANILNSELNAGIHETLFNASDFSSGVYFYRMEAHGIDGSNFISTKRMVLIK